ncbi:MAG: hypothetical protein HC793_01505 [Aquincola sp.]|nr:hypothetical protein [Aquincola sp.]
MSATTLRLQYAVMDRRADSIGVSAFWGDFGAFGNSQGDCALSEDQTGLPGWCASEAQVVELGKTAVRLRFPACVQGDTTVVFEYSLPTINPVNTTTRGRIDYGHRRYRVDMVCVDGTYSKTFDVLKQRPAYCRTGFRTISGEVLDELLTQDFLCTAEQDDVVFIQAPIQQCGSCAGSPNPIHPATGEKQRHESDFVFAGTPFTRHYRSLRQFRNNRSFAIGWSHTWSDRIITGATASEPYDHIDEQGNFEAYTFVSSGRYRGQTSTDRVLERVNANGIGWRLRFPDGEVREFDLNGFLSAVRHPDDPRSDVSIAWADQSVSTVTDAQGRVLQFIYANKLLQRIVLPDGSEYLYGHDADRNLTSVLNPDWSMRMYHYNEAGLAAPPISVTS